ncbi:hypothetical protein TcBrA4_0109710 [Trypanosoma cruzi]|nr:hypothetical protein TcBrA4_0109710 [Trypanosoma cruzi]
MAGVRGTLFQCMFACSHTGHQTTRNIRCLEEFRELLPTMVLRSADRFRAAAAPHVVVYVFVSNYEWRESEALSFNVCLRVHTLDTKQPGTIRCLEEFRELLPTMVLRSADRFRAAAAPHVVVYVFVSNYEWRESEALSFNVCLRVHTLDTKQPGISAAWRNFASSCPQWCCGRRIVFERLLHHTLWSMFLFRTMNGESEALSFNVCLRVHTLDTKQPGIIRCLEEFRELLPTMVLRSADRFRAAAAPHVVVYVFVSNYEWRESEALSFNVCLRVHTLDTKQPGIIRCLEEFRELLPTMVLRSADRFRAAAAPHVAVYVFVSNYEWRESEALSFNVCLRVHTLDTKQPGIIRCLEEFRELLPTMVLRSADRFRAAAAPHVVVYVFVSNYEWRESEALSFNVCLRVHTLDTKQP